MRWRNTSAWRRWMPDDPENYLQMAEMHRQLHQLDEAEKNIVQAKQRAPGNLEVVYSEAMIYEAQGRYEDAIRVLSCRGGQPEVGNHRRAVESAFAGGALRTTRARLSWTRRIITAALNTFRRIGAAWATKKRGAQHLDKCGHVSRRARDLPHALEAADKALSRNIRRIANFASLARCCSAKRAIPIRRPRSCAQC